MARVLDVARVIDDLASIPSGSYEAAGFRFLRGAEDVLGVADGFVLIARRATRGPGHVEGWNVGHLRHLREDAARDREIAMFLASGQAAADPRTRALARGSGRDRAFLRSELVSDDAWEGSPASRLERRLGRGEAIHAATPFDAHTEIYAGVWRGVADPPFDRDDRDTLLALLVGARASLRRVARGLGVFEPDPGLTRRQREVLDLLLAGLSEKEMACRLGITAGSVHQHVVAIYRVFRVRSRPELMAIWVHGGPTTDAGSPGTH